MYLLYLKDTLFPVAPEKIETKIKSENKTLTLLNEGEINRIKRPGLSELKFSLLLPNVKYPFATYAGEFQKADYFLSVLEDIKNSLEPFYLRILRLGPTGFLAESTDLYVSLEEYSIIEDVGEGLDFVVSISLKEYRPYVTKTVEFKKDEEGNNNAGSKNKRDTAGKKKEKTYTIQSGDTLITIARKKLGDSSKYKKLYTWNKTTIEKAAKSHGRSSSSNGHWIYPGTVLKLQA
ncbi:peptidoglycan-binding protein [Anaerolentibacter hominis]|uniref:LysM peptidoglycan-binding domain-containing protein n=1 Tax=Anaerolentibacter hominis TaxID=3079009 RepID=UPI0031B87825